MSDNRISTSQYFSPHGKGCLHHNNDDRFLNTFSPRYHKYSLDQGTESIYSTISQSLLGFSVLFCIFMNSQACSCLTPKLSMLSWQAHSACLWGRKCLYKLGRIRESHNISSVTYVGGWEGGRVGGRGLYHNQPQGSKPYFLPFFLSAKIQVFSLSRTGHLVNKNQEFWTGLEIWKYQHIKENMYEY